MPTGVVIAAARNASNSDVLILKPVRTSSRQVMIPSGNS